MCAVCVYVCLYCLIIHFCPTQVYDLAFSVDGSYFITVSNRRIRFWYFDTIGKSEKVGNMFGR